MLLREAVRVEKRADGKCAMGVAVAGVALRNPVIAASGTFGYGVEFEEILALDRIGAFVTKGLSREPMEGNRAPRIIETASGMINAIGLQNVGVEAFVRDKMPGIRKLRGAVCIANVFGFTVDDCVAVIERLNEADGIALYELNASCPNTKHGGMVFGTDAEALRELVERCREASARPLMVKLSPNVTSIAQMAKTAENAGADAVSPGEYVCVAGDRCGDAAAADCECDGRAERAGDQADCGADGVGGGAGGADSGGGDGRDRAGGGCGGVFAGGRDGGGGGHGELCGSAGGGEGGARVGGVVREAWGGTGGGVGGWVAGGVRMEARYFALPSFALP